METYLNALNQLDPTQYPEAARAAVMRLTDAELLDHRIWAGEDEPKRRQREQDRAQAQAELVVELQAQHPELKPEAVEEVEPAPTVEELVARVGRWEEPASVLNGYPVAALAASDGRVWRNRRPGNVKQPGTPFSGWEDVTADFLKLADAQDGNAEGVGTDAPGLITEPEPEVTPAPELREWKVGEWYSKGESVRVGNIAYTSLKLHKATEANHPTKGTPEWLKLG